jgi:hypothetical protein
VVSRHFSITFCIQQFILLFSNSSSSAK